MRVTDRDWLAVDLGPRDLEQARFERHTGLALALAMGVGEGLHIEVGELESDEHRLLLLDVGHETPHSGLRLGARDAAVEACALHIVHRPVQGRDLDGEEGLTAGPLHLSRPVEITDAGDVQIEVVVAHDGSLL